MVRIGLASLVLAVLPVGVVAQRPDGITLSAALVRLEGGDRNWGHVVAIGPEVQWRYSPDLRGGPALGIGYSWLRDTQTSLRVRGLFFEARYGFGSGSLIPYVTASHSHLRWTDGWITDIAGAAVNAGAGFMWAFASRVQVDAAAAVSVMYRSGTTFPKKPSATGLSLRVGLGATL